MSNLGKAKTAAEWAEDRAKALEINECFEMLAPTTDAFLDEAVFSREELEPLAAAIREGRHDLLELALSARHCSAPPENLDSRILLSAASAKEKAEAHKRREEFETSFRRSPKMLRKVAEWMVYLLVNGHCRQVRDAKDLRKDDVLEFIEKTFPEARLLDPSYEKPVIPPQENKKARAEFWRRAGVNLEQSRGWQSSVFKAAMKKIEEAQGKT